MGSGHILIAMFDVLMDIYESKGYGKREAAFDIVEHNIHGLDIDKRAYQLAYFAVMMKGRGYNRRFFDIFVSLYLTRWISSSHEAVLPRTWGRAASIINSNLTTHFLAEPHFMRIFAA